MKIAIAGAAGRMGRTLTRIASETSGIEIAGGLESSGSPQVGSDLGEIAGIGKLGVKVSNDPEWLLAHVDGIIDFTVPAATVTLSEIAARRRLVHVIGTTGLSETDEGKIRDAAQQARIVKSGNMSVGVNLLAALVEKIARTLPSNFDIEIVEMHHRHKVDAPSGTALLLGEAAAAGRNIELKEKAIRGRDGQTGPRPPGHIGFGSLRGGSVVGEHSVIFAGPSERIELVHRAESRDIFAHGAMRAALWAKDKQAGLYTIADVMELGD
ncbi:MAG TPA: 4-hydroxy-tetrahydrodipicolinate reductase [Aestuariivirgaceae bacterium]|nr:4-hydroxy-tetrahydrodipicolinate reductase [Aestuariivirgaceae bacterium]